MHVARLLFVVVALIIASALVPTLGTAAATDLSVTSGDPAANGDTIQATLNVATNGASATFVIDGDGDVATGPNGANGTDYVTVTDGGPNDTDGTADGSITTALVVDAETDSKFRDGTAYLLASEGSGDITTSGGEEASTPLTINENTDRPTVKSAVEFEAPDTGAVGSNTHTASVIEVAFAEPVRDASSSDALTMDDITVTVDGEDVTDRYTLDDDGSATSGSTNGGQLVLSSAEPVESSDIKISFGTMSDAGGADTNKINGYSVTYTGDTIAESSGDGDESTDEADAFKKTKVALVADDGREDIDNSFRVDRSDGEFVFEGSTGTNSQVYVFTTDRDPSKEYLFDLSADGGGPGVARLDLVPIGLKLDVDTDSVALGENVTGNVRLNRGGETVKLVLKYHDGENQQKRVEVRGDGTRDFELGPLDGTGTYRIVAQEVRSGVKTKSKKFSVQQGSATLGQTTVSGVRGETIEIPIELEDTSSAYVSIGSTAQNYRANFTVTDHNGDGTVVVRWNSYLADGRSDGIGEAFEAVESPNGDDDSVTVTSVESGIGGGDGSASEVIDAGDYAIDVGVSSTDLTQQGFLVVQSQPPHSLTMSTVPGDTDVDSLDALREGSQMETFANSTTVARGDFVVFRLDTRGLGGAIAAQPGENETQRFLEFATGGDAPAAFRLYQPEPGLNEAPRAFEVDDGSAVEVVSDESNSTHYVVVDVTSLDAVTDSDEDGAAWDESGDTTSVSGEATLQADFELNDSETDLVETSQSSSVEFDLVSRSLDVEDPYVVQSGSSIPVTAETTLAPGTEVSIRVKNTDDAETRFLEHTTATVRSNQTIATTVSRPIDQKDTFILSLSAVGIESTVEGQVVEAQKTSTPEETTSETTQKATTTTTDSSATTETAPTQTTDSEQAGLGQNTTESTEEAAALMGGESGGVGSVVLVGLVGFFTSVLVYATRYR